MVDKSRRSFIRKGMFGLAVLPFGAGVLTNKAFAALPMVDPSAPNAKALNYVAVAANAAGHAAYQDGRKCENCNFFQPATGACPLFPGHAVEAAGWCQAWIKRP
jgi:hypothetical protein